MSTNNKNQEDSSHLGFASMPKKGSQGRSQMDEKSSSQEIQHKFAVEAEKEEHGQGFLQTKDSSDEAEEFSNNVLALLFGAE